MPDTVETLLEQWGDREAETAHAASLAPSPAFLTLARPERARRRTVLARIGAIALPIAAAAAVALYLALPGLRPPTTPAGPHTPTADGSAAPASSQARLGALRLANAAWDPDRLALPSDVSVAWVHTTPALDQTMLR